MLSLLDRYKDINDVKNVSYAKNSLLWKSEDF